MPYDFPAYIARLTAANRICRSEGFKPTTCSGINYLEGLLEDYADTSRFVCTSDVCDESLRQVAGGWMKRRLFTLFILSRFDYGDRSSQAAAMDLCREVSRQMLSRMLRDREEAVDSPLLYLDLSDVRSQELGGTFLQGATGLYMFIAMDEPTSIAYDETEWSEEDDNNQEEEAPTSSL